MIGIDGEKLVAIPLESFLGTRKIESDSYWYDLVVGRNTGQV